MDRLLGTIWTGSSGLYGQAPRGYAEQASQGYAEQTQGSIPVVILLWSGTDPSGLCGADPWAPFQKNLLRSGAVPRLRFKLVTALALEQAVILGVELLSLVLEEIVVHDIGHEQHEKQHQERGR